MVLEVMKITASFMHTGQQPKKRTAESWRGLCFHPAPRQDQQFVSSSPSNDDSDNRLPHPCRTRERPRKFDNGNQEALGWVVFQYVPEPVSE